MQFDKPGCFGNAITYSDMSSTCTGCEERSECRLAALQRLEELKPLISVDSILKMSHRPSQKLADTLVFEDLPETARKLIAMIPDNAKQTAAKLLRTKINFRKQLIEGVNPIKNQSPLALSVLFDLLIKGPVTRTAYMMELKTILGHSPSIAASQASIGVAVAIGLGIAKSDGEKMTIRS